MTSEDTPENSRESKLIWDLSSSKRTARIAAVVQLSKIGKSRKALHELRKIENDPDREVSLFAQQAIVRILARQGEKISGSQTGLTQERLLTPLPAEIPVLLEDIRKGEEIPEDLRPAVADFLGKNGSPGDGELLLSWLQSSKSTLSLAYVDALESLVPQKLLGVLPGLLASEHPLVRVRAIRTLIRIDPVEAMAHLSESLASRKAEERLAGLSIAFFFPFNEVKPLVMTMISEERDQDVLKGIEILFQLNPEVDTVLQLLDLIDLRPKEQSKDLTKIFKIVCNALRISEILKPEEAKAEAIIALWRKERLKKFLGNLEIQLNFCDDKKRVSIEDWLVKNAKTAEVVRFIERLGANPATEQMYQRLIKTLPVSTVLAYNLQDPEKQSPGQKKYLLSHLDEKAYISCLSWIRQEAEKGRIEVKIAALKAISKFGPEETDVKIALSGMNSPETGVQLAALQLISEKAPKRLVPFFPQLLVSNNAFVRAKGVRLAAKHDPAGALKTFRGLLVSADPGIRAMAISCLALFPFEQIFSTLMKQLANEDNSDIARQIILVLLSNPSGKVLQILDSVQNSKSPEVAILIAQARMDIFDTILQLGLDMETSGSDLPDLEVETENKTSEEALGKPKDESAPKEVTAKPSPIKAESKPYAVSEVRTTIRKREAAQKEKETAGEKQHQLYLGLAFLLIFGIAGAFMWKISTDRTYVADESYEKASDPANSTDRSIPIKFRLGAMCRLSGKIEKVNEDNSLVFISGDHKLLVKFSGKLPEVTEGDAVDLEVLPYRKRKKTGDYFADGYKLEKR